MYQKPGDLEKMENVFLKIIWQIYNKTSRSLGSARHLIKLLIYFKFLKKSNYYGSFTNIENGASNIKKKASKVKNFEEVSELILNMKDTLKFIGASGLAAPQVMISKRVIVYRVNKNRIPLSSKFSTKPWTYMINPEITPITKKKNVLGKMSITTRIAEKVPRYDKIFVKYYTPDNKLVEHEAHSNGLH